MTHGASIAKRIGTWIAKAGYFGQSWSFSHENMCKRHDPMHPTPGTSFRLLENFKVVVPSVGLGKCTTTGAMSWQCLVIAHHRSTGALEEIGPKLTKKWITQREYVETPSLSSTRVNIVQDYTAHQPRSDYLAVFARESEATIMGGRPKKSSKCGKTPKISNSTSNELYSIKDLPNQKQKFHI